VQGADHHILLQSTYSVRIQTQAESFAAKTARSMEPGYSSPGGGRGRTSGAESNWGLGHTADHLGNSGLHAGRSDAGVTPATEQP